MMDGCYITNHLKLIKKKRSGEFYCMGNTAITSKFLAQKIIKSFGYRVTD